MRMKIETAAARASHPADVGTGANDCEDIG